MQVLSILQKKQYTQSYKKNPTIDGVQILSLKHFTGDEGDFGEIFRFDTQGRSELVPSFQIRQVSRAMSFPGSVKGWHFHHKQNELWYLSPHQQLFVGLWDIREGSPTAGTMMRINLGGGNSKAIYIPHGVAHGYANFSQKNVELIYFVSEQFNLTEPDEHRVPWDGAGADFWKPERD